PIAAKVGGSPRPAQRTFLPAEGSGADGSATRFAGASVNGARARALALRRLRFSRKAAPRRSARAARALALLLSPMDPTSGRSRRGLRLHRFRPYGKDRRLRTRIERRTLPPSSGALPS